MNSHFMNHHEEINKYLQNLYNNIIDSLMSYRNIWSFWKFAASTAIPFSLDMVKLRSFMATSISIKLKVEHFSTNNLMHDYFISNKIRNVQVANRNCI